MNDVGRTEYYVWPWPPLRDESSVEVRESDRGVSSNKGQWILSGAFHEGSEVIAQLSNLKYLHCLKLKYSFATDQKYFGKRSVNI